MKSQDSSCLEEWWNEFGLEKYKYLKKKLPVENWFVVETPENLSNSLKQLPCIQSILVDEVLKNYSTIPDDPEFPNQTDMDLIGMPAAWDISTGGFTARGDTIVVASIDDGFQVHHEDIEDNLWHNPREIPQDGIDNDNNGYIDDYFGVNITTGKDNHPILSHGTSVSGIIGAKGNNGKGTCGINWNVKIMLISYDHHISSLVEAYQYVLEMRKKYNHTHGKEGAFVVAVNLSSGIEFGKAENFPLWCSMYDKLGAEGILSVCSASNDHHNVERDGDLPARCISPYTIIVTNVNSQDQLMENAAYGRISVDLGAPGEHSLTTDTSNTYNYFRGTSAAAPHVTGTVGLLYSVVCSTFFDSLDANPGSVATKIKNLILSTASPNPSLNGITLSGKRLQADAAMQTLLGTCGGNIQNKAFIRFISPNPAGSGKTKLFFEILGTNSKIYLEIYSLNGVQIQNSILNPEELIQGFITINTKDLPAGLYFVTLRDENNIQTTKIIVK